MYQVIASNTGAWVPVDGVRIQQIIERILERETWYAPRVNRTPMTSPAEVIALLETGKPLPFGNDWDDRIRRAPTLRASATREMVMASCGHTVSRTILMSASMGTTCPDCYDRMSE